MSAIQTATFAILAGAFILRIPRAIRHREARLTWAASGIGALAILTLGTIVPQAALDAPLGGHNVIKLVQTSLALIAIWLGAQAAIALSPTGRRMAPPTLALMVALPIAPFLLIRRTGPTSLHFLDQSIRQFPAWLYAMLYMAALVYVAARLLLAFRRHAAVGAWLIKAGSAAIIAASLVEGVSFTVQLLIPTPASTSSALSASFDALFYLGVCAMSLGIIAYTSTRTLRQWQIPRILKQLEPAATAAPHTPTDPPQLAQLYQAIVTVRDRIVAGSIQPSPQQLRALRRGERIIAHSLDDPLRAGPATVTTYPGRPA